MNEKIRDTITKLIQNNKDLKLSISETNNELSRMNSMLRADIDAKVDEAYQRGYKDGLDEGIKEGKESTERGCDGCQWVGKGSDELPCVHCRKNYKDYYKRKEVDDEIKVGDEVFTPDGTKFVIIEVGGYFGEDGVGCFMMFGDSIDIIAGCFSFKKMGVAKTGRHFDIEGILEAMRK